MSQQTDVEGPEANATVEAGRRRRGGRATPMPDPPAQPVFASVARHRPVVFAVAGLALVGVCYTSFGLATLLAGSSAPSGRQIVQRPPSQVTAVAPPPQPLADACLQIEVTTFVDDDGNGVPDPSEVAVPGVPVTLVLASGVTTAEGTTDSSGRLSVVPAVRGPVTLEITDMSDVGLWPGPRLGPLVGTPVLAEPRCSVAVGYLWIDDWTLPRTWLDGSSATAPVAAARGASGAAGAGVQVHGRIWRDADSDGRFTPADAGVGRARVVLLDGAGHELARVRTTVSGLYSFANLAPHREYGVRVEGAGNLVGRAALGQHIAGESDTTAFRTGDAGLSVWGVDFVVVPGSS